jgi:GGDEF domain-containing protein
MRLAEHAALVATQKIADAEIFTLNGEVYIVVQKGLDDDPSLIIAKRIIAVPQPPQQVEASTDRTSGKVMDLAREADPTDNKPELSFKLASEKAEKQSTKKQPVEKRLETAKKAAKKAKKEKKNETEDN